MKIRNILGGFIIMACVTGCASTSNTDNGASAKEVFNLTDMQVLSAQKATKLISENNAIANLKFTADPCVLVYNGTVYVYGTNDSQQLEFTKGKESNGYGKINTLNLYSSKDLVNWTYEAEIPVAGRTNGTGAAKWATNSWAPAICTNKVDGKDKFFLYFADSGNGIGVLSSDSPTGPFVDPIGKPLISRSTPNTTGVYWLFDPAVFVDDDGTGYLYYGGGLKGDAKDMDVAHPKSARCVQLGKDMISIVGTPETIDPPFLFEDSGINKINGKYVYSYCTNWNDRNSVNIPASEVKPPIAVIGYMTSDKPLGPFTYQGYFLKNPSSYFGAGAGGNNHHWVFELNGKYYVAYHAPTEEKKLNLEQGGYRSLFINELTLGSDDEILPIQNNIRKDGVAQIGSFNAYEEVKATTMHSSRKIVVTENITIVPESNDAYVCIKGADLSSGASSISVKTSSRSQKGAVKVMIDHPVSGTELTTVTLDGEGDFTSEISFPEDLKEKQNIYLVFTGLVEVTSWKLNK